MSELKNTPIEDFDWDAYETGETAGDKSREELTKSYDETLNTVKDKDVTEGTVIAMNKREVVVNIGYKCLSKTRKTKRDSSFSHTARLALHAAGSA